MSHPHPPRWQPGNRKPGNARQYTRSSKTLGSTRNPTEDRPPHNRSGPRSLGSTTIRRRPREPQTPHTAPSTPPLARATTGATRSSPWMWTQVHWTIVDTSLKIRPTKLVTWLKNRDGEG